MIERIENGGWPNCLPLANEAIELVATTDVGPRIIRLGFIGDQNLFRTFDSMLGVSGATSGESTVGSACGTPRSPSPGRMR